MNVSPILEITSLKLFLHPIGQDDEQPIISYSGDSTKAPSIPYKAIFTSMPFYAILIAHTAQNWSFYTLLSELPTYMNQILHFDIKEV